MVKVKKVLSVSLLLLLTACSSKYHTVRRGETLYSISVKNKVSVNEIMHLNNLTSPRISEGQKLQIRGDKNVKGSPNYHVVKRGETLYRISVRYKIGVDELRRYNNLSDNNIYVGQRIYLHQGLAPKSTQTSTASASRASSPTLRSFRKPLKSISVTSRYGTRVHPVTGRRTTHHGVDLRAPMNTPVYAPYAGVVTYSGWMNGYGKIVIIDHGGGYTTRYAHLNRWIVGKGTKVKKGQLIAKTGNTGVSTGPHLHYEIRKNGNSIDPSSTL